MDILSHALWVLAFYKIINIELKKKLSILKAVFWGLFPDLFTFTIPFLFVIVSLLSGKHTSPETLFSNSSFISILYFLSHSLIIFLIIFFLCYFIFKRFIWELGGWFLHIIIDIPSHGSGTWATPYLWPFPSPIIIGIDWWTNSWIVLFNYTLLVIVFIYIIVRIKKH